MIPLDEYRASVRAWIARTDIPQVPKDPDGRFKTLRAWQKRLYEAGWLGVDWPAEHGGKGLTPLHQAAVLEELARAGAPLPVSRTNLDAVGPTVVAFGSDEQKQRWLPKLCSAEDLWCQGFSEPNAGSDLASLKTAATRDGDDFVITGQKIWTSQAHRADRILILARTDPSAPRYKDLSLFGVDMRSKGVTVRPLKQITGQSEFNEVFLDHVRVPAADLIGPLHDGWRVAMHTLGGERGRILLLRRADAEAAFRTLVKALRTHVAESKTPLSPDVVRRIGQVRMKLAALEGQVRATAKRMERDERPGPLDSLDRLVLVEVEQELSGLAFDLLGPYRMSGGAFPLSLDPDYTIYRYFYGRSYSLSGGTTQVQLNVVAERMLGLPRT
jgi:alkylation response protein AidB-like acyl-CoA dehydrogenase